MRRHRAMSHGPSHERWLVSYADFITLLFAFFVVMYAISSVNQSKYEVLSGALDAAFRGEAPARVQRGAGGLTPLLDGRARRLASERRALEVLARAMQAALDGALGAGQTTVAADDDGVQVEIRAGVLFVSGSARISAPAAAALARVAVVLRGDTRRLHVTGHSDDVPIATAEFASNWELSAGRAAAVARELIGSGVAPGRLTVLGEAANRPLASNATASGRAQNRRVTLKVMARRLGPPLAGA